MQTLETDPPELLEQLQLRRKVQLAVSLAKRLEPWVSGTKEDIRQEIIVMSDQAIKLGSSNLGKLLTGVIA